MDSGEDLMLHAELIYGLYVVNLHNNYVMVMS